MADLLSIADLDRATIDDLLAAARTLVSGHAPAPLRGQPAVVGLVFFQESLRTRVGFEVAAARAGASAVTAVATKNTPQMRSPESEYDAARCVADWCDVLCLRTADAQLAAALAADVRAPVVNCGNSSDEHPTQALIDLLAITELVGPVDGMTIAIVGDLLGMRTAHSLLLALASFSDVRVRCVTPPGLGMPRCYRDVFEAAGGVLQESADIALDDVDVVYVAGLPAETGAGALAADGRRPFRIDAAALSTLQPHARVLCPLPRVDEIARAVDASPHAAYFEQSQLGAAMRTAVLGWALA